MNKNKLQLEKRIKYLRIWHICSVTLVFISIAQIIFESRDSFISYWFVLILWTFVSILTWFELKKAKEQLQEKSELIN